MGGLVRLVLVVHVPGGASGQRAGDGMMMGHVAGNAAGDSAADAAFRGDRRSREKSGGKRDSDSSTNDVHR